MSKVNFECYEDNAGGLFLFIMDGDKPIEMFMGFEHFEKGALKEALDNIDCYRDWDNAISQKIANVRLTSRLKTHTTGCRTPSAI